MHTHQVGVSCSVFHVAPRTSLFNASAPVDLRTSHTARMFSQLEDKLFAKALRSLPVTLSEAMVKAEMDDTAVLQSHWRPRSSAVARVASGSTNLQSSTTRGLLKVTSLLRTTPRLRRRVPSATRLEWVRTCWANRRRGDESRRLRRGRLIRGRVFPNLTTPEDLVLDVVW